MNKYLYFWHSLFEFPALIWLARSLSPLFLLSSLQHSKIEPSFAERNTVHKDVASENMCMIVLLGLPLSPVKRKHCKICKVFL